MAVVVWFFIVIRMRNCIPFEFESIKRLRLSVILTIVMLNERGVLVFATLVLRVPAFLLSIAIEIMIVPKAILFLARIALHSVQVRLVSIVIQVQKFVIKRVLVVIISMLTRWPD